MRNLPAVRRLLPLIPALLLLAGCGGDDSGFTAEQFVSAVNQRGAALELGPELRSTRTDATIYALELGEPRAADEFADGEEAAIREAHAGGSLAVMPDADAGLAEHVRCEEAASLLCFRADNIVLLLEGDIDEEQYDALARALHAIADETAE